MAERISDALRADMERKGIDIPLTLEILDDYNAGLYDGVKPVRAAGVPAIDGWKVVDLRASRDPEAALLSVDADKARSRLAALGIAFPDAAPPKGGGSPNAVPPLAAFRAADLKKIGEALLSKTAYGVLNGGSATSYADRKKNLAFGPEAFEAAAPAFARMAELCRDKPKGVTPAYVNPDGSAGASFLELKMRARLLKLRESRLGGGEASQAAASREFLPLFQMSSIGTDAALAAHYAAAKSSPYLSTLAAELGVEPAPWRTGVQPLIAAFSHSGEGRPKRIFDAAFGVKDSSLALPGGHGQCFRVLAGVLSRLHEEGIRYACLGNVDNLGYVPDPVELAIIALSGQPAAFDFAARTPMDVKGGILVESESGGLTVADIGPAIGFDQVLELERKGFPILFNCASGIFDLDYLVPRIADIGRRLPVRFSDQDKDSGKYSQAEQVTWEVTGILPSFLAFAVDKTERFLAAKLLLDTLLTSGVGLDDPRLPAGVRETAESLHSGLAAMLRNVYGLECEKGRWTPRELL
ncbi:UTP--glucose-1-phosphate uridylyltransferase [bacterium]|nr:UTP--glucose-1-phosphate uridylyltransferase [bacterium]